MKNTIIIVLGIVLLGFANPTTDRAAKVAQMENLAVYINSSPNDEFEVLGSVSLTGIIRTYKASWVVEKMIEKAKKKYPKSQGIIFDLKADLVQATVIKFQSSSNQE